jgi:hypothetical protein
MRSSAPLNSQGVDTMLTQGMAKTEMTRFWQFIFDYCNEDYSCVLGWLLLGILIFLAVIVSLGLMMRRLNKRE